MYYAAAARGYLLPATPEAVAQLQAAYEPLGLLLHVPPTPALAVPMPRLRPTKLCSRAIASSLP